MKDKILQFILQKYSESQEAIINNYILTYYRNGNIPWKIYLTKTKLRSENMSRLIMSKDI